MPTCTLTPVKPSKPTVVFMPGNTSRRFLESASGGTFEKLGPCEGTLIATDSSNETIAVGGGNDIVVVVAVGDGDKVGVFERHGFVKTSSLSNRR